MEYRIYCELKINEKKTGKLLEVVTGIYYIDDVDVAQAISTPIEKIEDFFRKKYADMVTWLKADSSVDLPDDEVVYDLETLFLDDEFSDEEEEE